jgi:hypothetical protein
MSARHPECRLSSFLWKTLLSQSPRNRTYTLLEFVVSVSIFESEHAFHQTHTTVALASEKKPTFLSLLKPC